MYTVLRTDSLLYLCKLVKTEFIQVSVKKNSVKLIASVDEGKGKYLKQFQVILDENIYGNEKEGISNVPVRAILTLQKGANVILTSDGETGQLASENQIIRFKENKEPSMEIEFEAGEEVNVIKNMDLVLECIKTVAKDDTRPALRCIQIDEENAVSCDGYKLTVRKLDSTVEKPILLNECIISVIKKIKNEKYATITENEKLVKLSYGWITIIAQKEFNNFIKYNSLIPIDHKTKVIIDPKQLLKICNSTKNVSGRYYSTVKFKFSAKGSYIEVIEERELEFKRVIPAVVEGEEIEISVDLNKLILALKDYKEDLTLFLNSPVSPIVLKDKQETRLDLVLPIRLTNREEYKK